MVTESTYCPLFYWREVRIARSILQPTSDHMVTPLPTESQRENGLLIRERYLLAMRTSRRTVVVEGHGASVLFNV